MSDSKLRPFPAWMKHTGQRLAVLLATLSPKEKIVRMRDGDEDLVISWFTGLVPVGQGSSSHRGSHFQQQKARKVDGSIGALDGALDCRMHPSEVEISRLCNCQVTPEVSEWFQDVI